MEERICDTHNNNTNNKKKYHKIYASVPLFSIPAIKILTTAVDKQLNSDISLGSLSWQFLLLSLNAMSQSTIYASLSAMSVFRTWSHSQSPTKEQ